MVQKLIEIEEIIRNWFLWNATENQNLTQIKNINIISKSLIGTNKEQIKRNFKSTWLHRQARVSANLVQTNKLLIIMMLKTENFAASILRVETKQFNSQFIIWLLIMTVSRGLLFFLMFSLFVGKRIDRLKDWKKNWLKCSSTKDSLYLHTPYHLMLENEIESLPDLTENSQWISAQNPVKMN